MIISTLLTFFTAYFLSAIFGRFLYFYIIFIGLIILNIELLSLFKSISPIGIILLNTIFFVTAIACWLKNNIPILKFDIQKKVSVCKKIQNSLKLDKALIILGTGFVYLIIINFIMSFFLPVNDFDALSYHTYRALVWAEKGYIFHFDTSDVRNLVMPVNSELIYTWIYSLTKKDIGFGALEFFSFLFGIAGIWSFLERIKISIRKRLWAIFIFSSLAGIITQISSTQTDLFTGVLLLYSIILFIDFTKENNIKHGYFSSLSFAIALGVKSSAFMAGLPIVILFLIYSYKKSAVKNFTKFILLLAINFIFFSSYNYILNFIDYLNPFGSEIAINGHGFFGGIKAFIANFIRYNIQLFDFAGFKWGIYLSPLMLKLQNILFGLLGIKPETGVLIKMDGLNSSLAEHTIGFGITGFLAFVPSVLCGIFCLLKGIKTNLKEKWIILYSLGLLFYLNLAVLSFTIGFMVYSIRFVAAFVAISSPVLILSYCKKNNIYKTLVVLFACFYLFIASGHLAARPFYKLINEYKKEKSHNSFIYNTGCMNYYFYKGDKPGCKINDTILSYIEEYKTVGIFADGNVLMHPTKLQAIKKHILAEELILTRFDTYRLKVFDYIVTPYPLQPINTYNNKDKNNYPENGLPKYCYFSKNKNSKKTDGIECKPPYKEIEEKGFKAVYNIKIGWKDLDGNTKYSQYIIWKNTK